MPEDHLPALFSKLCALFFQPSCQMAKGGRVSLYGQPALGVRKQTAATENKEDERPRQDMGFPRWRGEPERCAAARPRKTDVNGQNRFYFSRSGAFIRMEPKCPIGHDCPVIRVSVLKDVAVGLSGGSVCPPHAIGGRIHGKKPESFCQSRTKGEQHESR